MVFISLSMDPSICGWVWISPPFGFPEKMTENIVFKRDLYFFSFFLSNQIELFLFSFLYHSKISTKMLLFVWRFMEDRLELLSPYMVLSSLSPFCRSPNFAKFIFWKHNSIIPFSLCEFWLLYNVQLWFLCLFLV